MSISQNKILILASGLSAKQFHDYPYKENNWIIFTVNHGWMTTPLWDYNIIPSDYKGKRPCVETNQKIIKRDEYVPILNNKYGGEQACGLSITLSAAYYSLGTLEPKIIGFLGCDMNYKPDANGWTTIYGLGNDIKKDGISDPDKMVQFQLKHGCKDPDYLFNIYKRFEKFANKQECKVFNFSNDPETRLPYKQIDILEIDWTC